MQRKVLSKQQIDAELLECLHRIALALECINRNFYKISIIMEEKEETSTNKEDQYSYIKGDKHD